MRHSDLLKFNEILSMDNKPLISIEDIFEKVNSIVSRDYSYFEIEDFLKVSPFYLDVGDGLFADAGKLLNGVTFFAIPEFYDLDNGRIFFMGSEFSFLFKNAFRDSVVRIESAGKKYDSFLIFEGGDMFYLTGFKDWFMRISFDEHDDIVKFTIVDYEKSIYKVEKVKNQVLDNLVKDDDITKLFEAVYQSLDSLEDLADEESSFNEDEFFSKSIPQLIKELIFQEVFDFRSFPANLSFFLPLDEQLEVINDLVRINLSSDSIMNEDFASYYMGKDLDFKLADEDISILDRALVLLFDDNNPEKAVDFLYDLKKRYPSEKIINKFLYQAYYVMGDLEKMVEFAEIYKTFFPDDPDSYRCIAEADFSNGDLDKAEKELKSSFKLLHPDDKLNRINIGVIWMHVNFLQGNYDGAYKKGKMVLKHDPENQEVLMFFRDNGLEVDLSKKETISNYKILDKKDEKVIKVDFSKDK